MLFVASIWYPCVYVSMYERVGLSYVEMFLNTRKPKQSCRCFADDISNVFSSLKTNVCVSNFT